MNKILINLIENNELKINVKYMPIYVFNIMINILGKIESIDIKIEGNYLRLSLVKIEFINGE